MHAYIQHLLDFAAQHSWLAAGLALLVSATEAMFVIGMFVPSTLVLVGLGGLIGAGNLPFWPLFLATTLGAVVGDAFSYWLGHHYKERLYTIWPISRYQDLLHKGQDYFAVHGGKSVVIGRFIPGVKSVVPVIAGMMQMSQMRFAILNILSSLAWAATHLLPGISAGWLVGSLAGISRRLAITLVLILALAALLVWLIRLAFRWGAYYWPRWTQALQDWVEQSPKRQQGLIGQLVLADYANFRKEAMMYVLLALALSAFMVVMVNVLLNTGLGGLDQALSESLQGLRTYWSDVPMLVATLSGDAWVVVGVLIAMLALLFWQGNRHLALGVGLAFLIASVFIFGLKGIMQVDRPIARLYKGLDAYSFPSGHAGFSTLLAGLLAWFVIKGWTGKKRIFTVSLLVLMVGLIALSRIYLGAHWPSDILGSWFFASALVLVFALVFQQEAVSSQLTLRVLLVAGLSFALIATWHITSGWQAAVTKYAAQEPVPIPLTQAWQQGGWQELPAYRQDIYGELEEPFLLQWQGELQALQTALPDWTIAPDWSPTVLNGFALGHTPANQLPALPKLHAGHVQDLTLLKVDEQGRYVLRLYAQAITTPSHPAQTLWLGTITYEFLYHPFGQLSYLHSDDERACAESALSQLPHALVVGEALVGTPENAGCSGQRVLAYE